MWGRGQAESCFDDRADCTKQLIGVDVKMNFLMKGVASLGHGSRSTACWAAYFPIGPQPISFANHAQAPLPQAIGWVIDTAATPIQDMRVDHGRADIPVPQQLLDRPDVIPVFEEVRGEWVPQRMATGRPSEPCSTGGVLAYQITR
jgi:hypothetical protein